MVRVRSTALLGALLVLSGCHRNYVIPEEPMPPNTILLSQMMHELSAQPGFTSALVDKIDKSGKKGPALLTPRLVNELRKRIFGRDWQGLDRFPGWTMREINPAVDVARHVAGKDHGLEAAAAVHPGTPPSQAHINQTRTGEYLDLGPYALDQRQTLSLDAPSAFPPFTTQGIVTDLGDGVVRGDGPNSFAPEHAQSQRLADALNRLAVNSLAGTQPFMVTVHGHNAKSPEALMEALAATGHQVVVDDARYFANFAHLHYERRGSSASAQDVMAPFWIDSQIIVPGTRGLFHKGRPLLIPASHAELEWHIRGPQVNADISYYFGIDGKSEWRTMDTLDQAWVLKRNANQYNGAQAAEVTRLAGLLSVAYMHLHEDYPALPFGGYYALGVCQDGVSAIEKRMAGRVTLFPNTADDALFNDSRDAEVNAMIAAIPKDRAGHAPQPARIFGSLPVAPVANAKGPFDAVTIPGLAADLNATYAAWQKGHLERTRSWIGVLAVSVAAVFAFAGLLAWVAARRRRHPR